MIKKILARPSLLTNLSDEERNLYEKALHQFIEGHGHGANLEKLHTMHKLYSIRANQKIRLILTPVKRGQEQVWLWVETLENHQYEHLKQIDTHWLVRLANELQEEDVEAAADAAEPLAEKRFEVLPDSGIEYHNQRFILLDACQKKVQSSRLPLLISGAPGSGKSLLGLSWLRQYVANNVPDGDERDVVHLLYVAQSKNLVEHIREQWQEIHEVEGFAAKKYVLDIKTPEQLFLDYYERLGEAPLARKDQKDFTQWFTQHIRSEMKLLSRLAVSSHKKSSGKSDKNKSEEGLFLEYLEAHPDLVYQEFRTISGYRESFSKYNEDVGGKYSMFTQETERQWLWDTFQKYMQFLRSVDAVDLFFHPILSNVLYELVIGDEAQDLSREQLLSLLKLVMGNRIVLCFSDRQRLNDCRKISSYMKSLFMKEDGAIEVTYHSLNSSYRCPQVVIDFVNAVLQLKYHVTGVHEKDEAMFVQSSASHADAGQSFWYEKDEAMFVQSSASDADTGQSFWYEKDAELEPMRNDKENVDFGVVTTSAFRLEAEQQFGADRVFTPEEIKGLEYKHILLYKLFDDKKWSAVNKVVASDLVLHQNPDAHAIPKSYAPDISYNTVFNRLFVACTRAQESITIYQPSLRAVERVTAPLKKFVALQQQPAQHPQATPTKSTAEEWRQRQAALEAQDQVVKARTISKRFPKEPSTSEIKESDQSEKEKTNKKPKKNTSPSAPVAAKKTVSEIEREINKISSKIIIGGQNEREHNRAISDLVHHEKVLEILFHSVVALPDKPSLYRFMIESGWEKKLCANLINVLDKLIDNAKSNKSEIDRVMNLICYINAREGMGSNKLSLFALLLDSGLLTERHLSFFKKHILLGEMKALFFTRDDCGIDLYEYALYIENIALLKKIHTLVDLNTLRFEHGMTVVHLAVQLKKFATLHALHELKVDMNIADDFARTPMSLAAILGFDVIIQKLHMLGVNIKQMDSLGITPLHYASCQGNLNAYQTLCQLGADPSILFERIEIPSIRLISGKEVPPIMKKFIELNRQTSIGEEIKRVTTEIAAQHNNVNVVNKVIFDLLTHEYARDILFFPLPQLANRSFYYYITRKRWIEKLCLNLVNMLNQFINTTDDNKEVSINRFVALICHVDGGQDVPATHRSLLALLLASKEVTEAHLLLLKKYISLEQLNEVFLLRDCNNMSLSQYAVSTPPFLLLKNIHTFLNFKTFCFAQGMTIAHYAVQAQQIGALSVLFCLGIDFHMMDQFDMFSLSVAACLGYDLVVKTLCNFKVNINHADNNGTTSLHHAVNAEQITTVEVLCELGADINALSKKHGTPVHLAARKEDVAMLKKLYELGARFDIKDSDGREPINCTDNICVKNLIISFLRHVEDKEKVSKGLARSSIFSVKNIEQKPVLESQESSSVLLPH